ncbi:oxidoreductase [Streptomyces hydrogenans]|uniref:Short-chain dehydrogenase/reductase n=1 Tax=Streptomyces hydrogenans TaxID=1873719 RepID=A0ABQ3PE75_9ACTN|nr:oxidoreductase [Streptomyces hydrogenans]GHG15097.1 putative short-chain dehydrogenase/reductase [Streptomyces hydrogenans]GHI23329.1 putative short-chain dehydrogenase/reductase [Streptomyces hydrogenans]
MSRTPTRHWTADNIPDLTGRIHVVTGATGGLGLATTRALALRGGRVVLAVRDEEKGHRAVAGLAAEGIAPDLLTVRRIDLADLGSVRAFAEGLRAEHPRLDVLVNNAGVMGPPRTLSAQGHELQFAANHLGHFALTGLLLDRLPDGGRVVTVSSLVHRQGELRLDDPASLTGERGYAPMAFYNRSKLANAVFGHELHHRLTAAGSPVRSVLAHPGYTATGLQTRDVTGLARFFYGRIGNPLLAQRPERGALPQLYAATAPEAAGGEFIGPDGLGELRGSPTRVKPSATAADPETGRRLWDLSEELTGVRYGLTAS